MIFLTVPLAMYAPIVERESTLTMIPPLNLNARVVVPLANLISWLASLFPEADAKLERQYSAGYNNERGEEREEEVSVFLLKSQGNNKHIFPTVSTQNFALHTLTSWTLGTSNCPGAPKTRGAGARVDAPTPL